MWRFEKGERYCCTEIYSWNGKFEIDVYSRTVYRQKIRQIWKITIPIWLLCIIRIVFFVFYVFLLTLYPMYPAFPPKDLSKERSFPPLKIFCDVVSGTLLLNFREKIEEFGGIFESEWRMILLWVFFGWFSKKKSIVE